MNPFPIDPDNLKTLYANGHITAEGLTAIAPISWLAIHFPALVANQEQTEKAIAACQPKTCKSCIHFSSVHQCCMTRLLEDNTYLSTTPQTLACLDFEGVELPVFVNRGVR